MAIKIIPCFDNSCSTRIFGRKPVRGGSPESDSNVIMRIAAMTGHFDQLDAT